MKKTVGKLMVMNEDGSNQRAVLTETGVEYGEMDWSPDDSKILFVQGPSGQLYTINYDGTGLTPICPGVDFSWRSPKWRRNP